MHPKRSLTALAALLLLCTGVAQAPGGACASPQTEAVVQETMLTQTLGLTLPPSLLVLERTEGPTSASYRVLARTSVTDVAQKVGEALPGWTRVSSGRELRGVTSGYTATYTDAGARTLRLRVKPIGRSNLFMLELKLTE